MNIIKKCINYKKKKYTNNFILYLKKISNIQIHRIDNRQVKIYVGKFCNNSYCHDNVVPNDRILHYYFFCISL